MRIIKHPITRPLDTSNATRLLGYNPVEQHHYQHKAGDFGMDFRPEWMDRAISILLEKQDVEVSEPTLIHLFDEDGSQIFASLILVDVDPEYTHLVDGKKITRVETIGATYTEPDGRVIVAEYSINPDMYIMRRAVLPDRTYLQRLKCFNEL